MNQIKKDPSVVPEGRASAQGSSVQPTTVSSGPKTQNLTVVYNCNGNAFNDSAPSDSHGAIGRQGYVEVTNTTIGIYSRTSCTKLGGATLNAFLLVPAGQSAFDPRAVYDKAKDRYIVTAETSGSGNDQYQIYAISKTANPNGAYWVYQFALSQGTSVFCKNVASDFWDYPQLGFNRNSVFSTANVFGSNFGAILSINKDAMLVGGSTTATCFKNLAFNIAPPINRSAKGNIAYFVSPGSGSGSNLTKYTVNT
ncbi:MAG: hypothetical protein WCD18_04100, partial [Thermosynechococcaceae cyanobacterium]